MKPSSVNIIKKKSTSLYDKKNKIEKKGNKEYGKTCIHIHIRLQRKEIKSENVKHVYTY